MSKRCFIGDLQRFLSELVLNVGPVWSDHVKKNCFHLPYNLSDLYSGAHGQKATLQEEITVCLFFYQQLSKLFNLWKLIKLESNPFLIQCRCNKEWRHMLLFVHAVGKSFHFYERTSSLKCHLKSQHALWLWKQLWTCFTRSNVKRRNDLRNVDL